MRKPHPGAVIAAGIVVLLLAGNFVFGLVIGAFTIPAALMLAIVTVGLWVYIFISEFVRYVRKLRS